MVLNVAFAKHSRWSNRCGTLPRWKGFCRPDKAEPPSGNGAAGKMPDGAGAYPAYAVSAASLPQAG